MHDTRTDSRYAIIIIILDKYYSNIKLTWRYRSRYSRIRPTDTRTSRESYRNTAGKEWEILWWQSCVFDVTATNIDSMHIIRVKVLNYGETW